VNYPSSVAEVDAAPDWMLEAWAAHLPSPACDVERHLFDRVTARRRTRQQREMDARPEVTGHAR
jgi:hypothetical protein